VQIVLELFSIVGLGKGAASQVAEKVWFAGFGKGTASAVPIGANKHAGFSP